MFAEPAATPLMSPVGETVAMPVLFDAHVKTIPCKTCPAASSATACA